MLILFLYSVIELGMLLNTNFLHFLFFVCLIVTISRSYYFVWILSILLCVDSFFANNSVSINVSSKFVGSIYLEEYKFLEYNEIFFIQYILSDLLKKLLKANFVKHSP